MEGKEDRINSEQGRMNSFAIEHTKAYSLVTLNHTLNHLSTLFMILSVSAPFLTAQFRRLVTLKALLREMPAEPALGAAKTASRADAKTMLLPV
jgi:hypothetical protein